MAEYSNYMWSVPDWRTDEMYVELDNREQGIYRNLLDECFLAGSITADPIILARFVREPLDYFNLVWAKIRHKFRSIHNGERLTNPRMNVDRRRLQTIREKRKKSASTAAKSRWANVSKNNELDALRINDAMRQDAQTQTQTHKEGEDGSLLQDSSNLQDGSPFLVLSTAKNAPSTALDLMAEFQPRWERYPNRDGRKDAERHWKSSVRTAGDMADFDRALDHYVEHLRVTGYAPKNGKTFFNNWRDWVDWKEPERANGNSNGTHTKESYAERVARRNREITLEVDQQLSGPTGDSSRNGSDERTAGALLPGITRHR